MSFKADLFKINGLPVKILAFVIFVVIAIMVIPGNVGQTKADDSGQPPSQDDPSGTTAGSGAVAPEAVIPPILTDLLPSSNAPSGASASYYAVFAPDAPKAPYTQQVPFINQYPELPTGCEAVALTEALQSMGFDLGKTDIADFYLSYSGNDFVNAYVGDPSSYEGVGVYPPGLVDAANRYLAAQGSDMRAYNITGTDWDNLFVYIDKGYPVVIWVTIGGSTPTFDGSGYEGWEWYENEHCVVLYGVDRDAGTVSISDPTYGYCQHDYDAYGRLFAACGNMAMVIY